MFTVIGFFFERMQLRVYLTLSDVWYVIFKVFRSSTTFLYIGQKNMHPKKSYDILKFFFFFQAIVDHFTTITAGVVFWYVIAQSFSDMTVYSTKKILYGLRGATSVWTHATASTPAQNKAVNFQI